MTPHVYNKGLPCLEGKGWALPERALFLECQAHKNNWQQFPLPKEENHALLAKEECLIQLQKQLVEILKRRRRDGGGS